MPRFEPFPALRYLTEPLEQVTAPPYDVLSESDIDALAARSEYNIVRVDVPREHDGADRYDRAGDLLRQWIANGVIGRDSEPSFTLYRMRFADATGTNRDIVGVLGGLEVVDEGAGGVLAHERVTPKASTDRLDLTRATRANMSPIWVLSLASGLSDLLAAPGEPLGSVVVDGVEHVVERVTDPARVAAIGTAVGSDDTLIADGHHRYGVARTYRDEVRAVTGTDGSSAELTLAFISELVADQLSVEAIHRLYAGIDFDQFRNALASCFTMEPAGTVDDATLVTMRGRGSLCLVGPDRSATWLTPRADELADVRAIDGAILEHALAPVSASVTYQHSVEAVCDAVDAGAATAGVLIRPVSVPEIERTAREGALMPPKSTFFTPKLLTGLVVRPLD